MECNKHKTIRNYPKENYPIIKIEKKLDKHYQRPGKVIILHLVVFWLKLHLNALVLKMLQLLKKVKHEALQGRSQFFPTD